MHGKEDLKKNQQEEAVQRGSRAAEFSLRVVGTISNEEGR
jgi:hypothetical protein